MSKNNSGNFAVTEKNRNAQRRFFAGNKNQGVEQEEEGGGRGLRSGAGGGGTERRWRRSRAEPTQPGQAALLLGLQPARLESISIRLATEQRGLVYCRASASECVQVSTPVILLGRR